MPDVIPYNNVGFDVAVSLDHAKKKICQNYNFKTTIFVWSKLLKKIYW